MTLDILRTYWSLLKQFRNGPALVRNLRGGTTCDEAVLWDGTRLGHPPGKDGLVQTLVDLWVERCLMPPWFYRPTAGDVLIDCGAHVGLFTVLMARANPGCRVESLEPFAENYRFLEANIRAACPGNATPHHVAVGRSRGRGHSVPPPPGGRTIDTQFVAETDADPRATGADAESVPILVLEDLPALARVDRVAFLKVDIEGSEHDLFADARPEVLGRFERIGMEYHDNLRPGTLDLLKDRLAPSHDVTVIPAHGFDCGVLLAKRR